jgi:hypothetical protein
MLWGYEIRDGRGFLLGDEGDYVFREKTDAYLDALSYAKDIVREQDIEGDEFSITLQPIDEDDVINPDYIH